MKSTAKRIAEYLIGSLALACLITTTIRITTIQASASVFTTNLHFPLFLIISTAVIAMLPHKYRKPVYLGISFTLFIELALFSTLLQR